MKKYNNFKFKKVLWHELELGRGLLDCEHDYGMADYNPFVDKIHTDDDWVIYEVDDFGDLVYIRFGVYWSLDEESGTGYEYYLVTEKYHFQNVL